MTSSADLFGLQEVDLRRDARRSLIADIESRLMETEELLNAREEAADAAEQAERLRKEQRELESQIQDLAAKIAALDEKLYGGSVRNPKELSDLQKEVEMFKAQRSRLDDEALASLEVIEVATASAQEAKEDLTRIEADWKAKQKKMKQDKKAAEQEMIRLDADYEARIKTIDRSTLGIYENLRKSKQGRAVAILSQGTCQGCRVTLPTNMVGKVRAAGTMVQCPRCERILVAG